MSVAEKVKMDKIKNLHHVSAIYFFIFSLAYVFMAIAFRNDFMADVFLVIMRVLDIPLAFVSLLYGGSSLIIQMNVSRDPEAGFSPWTLVVFTVCLLLFATVVFVNFAFPSQL